MTQTQEKLKLMVMAGVAIKKTGKNVNEETYTSKVQNKYITQLSLIEYLPNFIQGLRP